MQPLTSDDPQQVGPFRIIELLGAGGMGRVYLGRAADGRTVAVKTARRELVDGGSFRKRFAREVAAAQRVGGPFVAPVVDAAPHADVPWMATEYVPGLSLSTVVARYGPLPEDAVASLASGVLQALSAVHAQGLVHRDLKPSNIILTSTGPRVIDFGIARSALDTVLTTDGAVLGTPGFMAPEQLTMGPEVTGAADVFAFGGVLVYAATGNGPFGTAHPQVLMYRTARDAPWLDGVPEDLARTARACLSKAPDRRPTITALMAHFGTPHFDNWLSGPLDAELRRLFARLNDPRAAFALRTESDRPSPGAFEAAGVRAVPDGLKAPEGASVTGGKGPAPSGPAPEPQAPVRSAPPSAPPASSRTSRRSVLAALSFAGIAAGGGTLTWALWPKGTRDGTDSDKPASTGTAKPAFELPSGQRKIDAVMPLPDVPDPDAPSDYWLFAGDRYLRVRISPGAYPVLENLKGPTELAEWTKTLGGLPGFQKGIDAVLRVPDESGRHSDKPSQYWVFSRDQYIRMEVAPEGRYGDTLKAGPEPIGDWTDAFEGLPWGTGIDAIVPVPDDPYQVWVFSGDKYVRTRLNADGEPGGSAQLGQSITSGWSGSMGSTAGFDRRIDAAIPLPGDRNTYWVFSGAQYMKIHVTDKKYTDTVLQEPRTLRTEPM
ncbi:protein kinase [Streptomyces sp. NPDC007346]|uniref:protein kinase domain-containing protein n=1 Tax=Streptomyces sp. NPDC007346 TaxID=3154682 RepID=UPI003452BE36